MLSLTAIHCPYFPRVFSGVCGGSDAAEDAGFCCEVEDSFGVEEGSSFALDEFVVESFLLSSNA